jgi:hypothetical protein
MDNFGIKSASSLGGVYDPNQAKDICEENIAAAYDKAQYAAKVQVTRFSPRVESFRHSAAINQERASRNARAVELFEKYPFFEELIELLEIVPVRFIKA